jgi:hypothetical protein
VAESSICVFFTRSLTTALEELDELTLDAFRRKYEALATEARRALAEGQKDTNTPEAQPLQWRLTPPSSGQAPAILCLPLMSNAPVQRRRGAPQGRRPKSMENDARTS